METTAPHREQRGDRKARGSKGKDLLQRAVGMEQQEWPQAAGIQGVFGQHSQTLGLGLIPLWNPELDTIILVGYFQFGSFYSSVEKQTNKKTILKGTESNSY